MRTRNEIVLPGEVEEVVHEIAALVKGVGGRALLVGGCVRDYLVGREAKDFDVEVFGVEAEKLEGMLSEKFGIHTIGRSFGVFKVRDLEIDVSIPRGEVKVGLGHKGFEVYGDPYLSYEEASSRRDFTMNAMMYDPLTHEILDPHGGRGDLERGVLRHVSEKFSEDPLRVMRGMQFVARFELKVDGETLALCKRITPETLPKERIFDEWAKLLTKGVKPSLGMKFLLDTGWIGYYPELEALIGCEQDAMWHPEGDVWVHTLHCLDDFAKDRVGEYYEDLVVGFGVLCHDMGKPKTTVRGDDGRVRAPNHDTEGVPIARDFMMRLTNHQDLIESVLMLVEMHMRPVELLKGNAKDGAFRRLLHKLGKVDRLVRVFSADCGGRPPLTKDDFYDFLKVFYGRLEALNLRDSVPKPMLRGRDLLKMGLKPSPEFSEILDHCFEAQLEGEFDSEEGGLEYLKSYLHSRNS